LGSVEFGDEVEEFFSYTYSLVVRQDYKAANSKIVCFHPCMDNCHKRNRFVFVFCAVASDAGSKAAV